MPISRLRPQRAKIFGMPDSYGLDRNARCRLMAYARGWNASHRQPGQHKGPVTRAFLEVLQALVFCFANSRTGSCFPSYEAIAAKTGCARSTVALAIPALEASGVLRVVNRLRREGSRVLRRSNAYVFRDIPPSSENRPRTRTLKDSLPFLPAESRRAPPPTAVVDPDSPLGRALNRLGKTIEGSPQPG